LPHHRKFQRIIGKRWQSLGDSRFPTKVTSRSDRRRTFTYTSVSYAPVADSVLELPQAVKALL
jgi:hypothetical protein